MPESIAWFKDGTSGAGLRSVNEQLKGLDAIRPFCRRGSILDLGAAEGSIGKHFVDTEGADLLHGIEAVPERVEAARKACKGYEGVQFWAADLNAPEAVQGLLAQYDVVLALAIAHKLTNPEKFARWAAGKARKVIAIRMPTASAIFRDPRSEYRSFDPGKLLSKWDLIADGDGPRSERTMVWKRR